MYIKCWGSRGSIPVSGKEYLKYGGDTTCLEIRTQSDDIVIIDAGTGIIDLGAKLVAEREQSGRPIVGTLLFTHGHHDHTQGLSQFAPFRFGDSCFHVLGPHVFGMDLREVLERAMLPSVYPTPLDHLHGMCSVRNVRENQAIVLLQPGTQPLVKDLDVGHLRGAV